MRFLKLSLCIGGCGLIVASAVALTMSFFNYRHVNAFVNSASRAQATVTRLIERSGTDSGKIYYPVFTFEDSKGKTHRIDSSSGSYPPAYKVGDIVTVLYRPEQPDHAIPDNFFDLRGWCVMLGGFGIVDLVIGVGMLFLAFSVRRRNKKVCQPASTTETLGKPPLFIG